MAKATWDDLPQEILVKIATNIIEFDNEENTANSPKDATFEISFSRINKSSRSAFFEALGKQYTVMEMRFYPSTQPGEDLKLKEYFKTHKLNLKSLKTLRLGENGLGSKMSIVTLDLEYRLHDTIPAKTAYCLLTKETVLMEALLIHARSDCYNRLIVNFRMLSKTTIEQLLEMMTVFTQTIRNMRSIIIPCSAFSIPTLSGLSPARTAFITPDNLTTFWDYQLDMIDLLHVDGKAIGELLPMIVAVILITERPSKELSEVFADNPTLESRRMNQMWTNWISLLFLSLSDHLLNQVNSLSSQTAYILKQESLALDRLKTFLAFTSWIVSNVQRALQTHVQDPKLHQGMLRLMSRYAQLQLASARAAMLSGAPISRLVCEEEPQHLIAPDRLRTEVQDHLLQAHDAFAAIKDLLSTVEPTEDNIAQFIAFIEWCSAFEDVAQQIIRAKSLREGEIYTEVLLEPMTRFNRIPFYVSEDLSAD